MIFSWILFICYLLGTSYLGWLGYKKTKGDFKSFAIGKGDLSPFVVGITLATSTASAATFIINPGFIYVDGLSAFMHLGVGSFFGILTMLLILSFSFRRQGDQFMALTIPDWIGKRYSSPGYSFYFACVNLLSFAFIVLLVGGISIVMQKQLGISNITALVITLVFVTTYVLYGGTYAHVYTNMLQGVLMIIITILIIGSGIYVLFVIKPSLFTDMALANPEMLKISNPQSKLFNNHFSSWISGFLIGAALVCQPHILTKALYVKTDRDVGKYIAVFGVVYILFTALLLSGFWAHGVIPPEQLIDSESDQFRQDLVMTVYLYEVFPPWIFSIISIVLLAAAMSTLDGLLVGVSTITSNDLILNATQWISGSRMNSVNKHRLAVKFTQVILVIIAISVFFVNIHPPRLLGIFGQTGVYGLVVAAVPPLLYGVIFKDSPLIPLWILSVAAPLIHFILFFYGEMFFDRFGFSFANPGVTASIALLIVLIPLFLMGIYRMKFRPN